MTTGFPPSSSEESEHKRAEHETGDRSEQQQPEISPVKPFSEEIERGRNQRRTPANTNAVPTASPAVNPTIKTRAGTVKAAAANAGQTNGDSYEDPRKKLICRLSPKKCECRIRASFRPIARISDC